VYLVYLSSYLWGVMLGCFGWLLGFLWVVMGCACVGVFLGVGCGLVLGEFFL